MAREPLWGEPLSACVKVLRLRFWAGTKTAFLSSPVPGPAKTSRVLRVLSALHTLAKVCASID
jgi:hypothetical protein